MLCPSQFSTLNHSNYESLQIEVDNRELKQYIGSSLTREINVKIVIAKEAFNRKISLLTSKLNIELGKKLVRCYVWSFVFIWFRDPETKLYSISS